MRAFWPPLLLVASLGCQTSGGGAAHTGAPIETPALAAKALVPKVSTESMPAVQVLPRSGEALTADERDAEAATVTKVMSAFLADARPYAGASFHLKTTVVLDPTLRGDENHQPEPGVCYDEKHIVILNRDLWLAYTEAEREVVLYHELGHCELSRRHTTGRREGGGPESVMNRNSVADVRFFEADRAYYLHELFTNYPSPVHFRVHSTSAYTPPESPAAGAPGH